MEETSPGFSEKWPKEYPNSRFFYLQRFVRKKLTEGQQGKAGKTTIFISNKKAILQG